MYKFLTDDKEYNIPLDQLTKIPYLKKHMEQNINRLDISPATMDLILMRLPGFTTDPYINDFFNESIEVTKSDFYKITVDNTIFYTTIKTLSRSTQLENLIDGTHEINLPSQDPKVFEHLLEHLRNPHYIIPDQYYSELKLYGIKKVDIFDTIKYTDNVYLLYRAPDVYLTGNPQITFFKSVYKRHMTFGSSKTIMDPSKVSGDLYEFNVDQIGMLSTMFLKLGSDKLTDIVGAGLYVRHEISGQVIELDYKSRGAIQMDIDVNLSYTVYYKMLNKIMCIPLNFNCSVLTSNFPVGMLENYVMYVQVQLAPSEKYRKIQLAYDVYPTDIISNRYNDVTLPMINFSAKDYAFDNYEANISISFGSLEKTVSAFTFFIEVDRNTDIYQSPNEKNQLIKAKIMDNRNAIIAHTDHLTSLHTFASLNYDMQYLMDNYYIINFCLQNPNQEQSTGHLRFIPGDIFSLKINTKCKKGTVWLGMHSRTNLVIQNGVIN